MSEQGHVSYTFYYLADKPKDQQEFNFIRNMFEVGKGLFNSEDGGWGANYFGYLICVTAEELLKEWEKKYPNATN